MLQHTPNHKAGDLGSQPAMKGASSTNLEVTPDHKPKQGSNVKMVIGTLMGFISAKETGTNQKSGDKKLEKTEESIQRLASQAKRFHAQSHNTPVTPNYLDDIRSRPQNDDSDPHTSIKRVQTLEQQSKKIDGMLERIGGHQSSSRLEQVQQAGASLKQRVSTSYINPEYFPHLHKSWFENDSTNAPEASSQDQNRLVAKFRQSNHHFDDQLATDQPETKTIFPEQTASGITFTPSRMNNSAQGSLDLSAYSVERLQDLQKKMAEAEKAREESLKQAQEAMLRLQQAESIIHEKEMKIKNQELYLEQIRNDKDEAENSRLKHVSLAQKLQEDQESLASLLKLKESYAASLKEQLDKSEAQRMRSMAQLLEIRGKLRIYCRLKPVPDQEERAVTIKDKDFKEVVFNFDQSKKAKPQLYFFDQVFAEQASQVEVYGEIDPFVQGTLDGNSVCIIAYGPTGSGKTHTLEGFNPDPDTVCELSGILPRSMAAITQHIHRKNGLEENPQEYLEMHLACLELYNDRLGDLLAKVPKSLKDPNEDEVAIGTDKQGKVVLQGLTKVKIRSMQEALDIIRQSNERRQTECTAFNSKSSRSHTIYRITISKAKSPEMVLGLLNIVDLAGSEKNSMAQDSAQQASASASREASLGPAQGNSSKRTSFALQQKQQALHQEKLKKIQNEANHINKSLTSLGRILRLIREQRSSGIRDRAIPYRESKLTRLLQDCIGGDAQTLLIINLNPAARHSGQTKEALLFSSSASV